MSQHRGADWCADHSSAVYVREDQLTQLVHDFFAQRIFGPQRRDHLAADLQRLADTFTADTVQHRRAELDRRIADIHRRQERLISELEEAGDITDSDLRQEFRIQNRFADLNTQQRGASGFLGRSADPDELLNAIRVAHRGDALLSRPPPAA